MTSDLKASITGLGMAGLTRRQTLSAGELALQAIDHALVDAGLAHRDVDGLLIAKSNVSHDDEVGLRLAKLSGLRDLRLLQVVEAEGASAIAMTHVAAMAVSFGLARHVVCIFADAPLRGGKRGSDAFGGVKSMSGVEGLRYGAGLFGAPALYALAARRYMMTYGTTTEDLCAVAISTREWATLNPLALFREPLSRDAYMSARPIAEPFRLFDCATPVDGAIAVIVSAADAARDLRAPPLPVLGVGQSHPIGAWQAPNEIGVSTGGKVAAEAAFGMAGVAPADVDILECYDAFTYNTLLALEEYGFCAPGEGGAFVAEGGTSATGALPTNTGGGHLSGYYLQGMTPLSEAVMQARGEAGVRQCARRDVVLAANVGGFFDYHACILLGGAG